MTIPASSTAVAHGASPAAAIAAIAAPPATAAVSTPPAAATAARKTAPAASSSRPPAKGLSAQQLLGAFRGKIEPVRRTLAYRFGALLVAFAMVLIPLLYIALIALVACAVYYHAVNHAAMLGAARGRGVILLFLVYMAPMIMGGILVFFMIKPLFARLGREGRSRSLTRDGEPLLFEFVDRVCAAVHAPRPKRIDVDCHINASAGFRRGVLSMFTNDLVLTIGMPLAAGLDTRQFAGVLAHEFGHFSQGAGMRLTYLIRTISAWLTRAVYERDHWDRKLADAAAETDFRFSWILYLSMLFIWLTRKVLWVFMAVGHAVGGYMLRQMEFDADRHEAQLAGSAAFESTARRLMVLNVAYQGAQADLGDFYRDGRLGDNLPRLMMVNVDQIPKKALAEINKMIDESKTGLFDTHPADSQRIASAQRENAPGLFHVEQPVSTLFSNFEQLSKNVTWDFYRDIFGPRFQPSDMHPLDDLLARQQREKAAGEATQRYFQGAFGILRPLHLPGGFARAPEDAAGAAARLKQARQQMLAARDAYQSQHKSFRDADSDLVRAAQAVALHKADCSAAAAPLGPQFAKSSQASATQNKSTMKKDQLSLQLGPFEQAAGERLFRALELLFAPQVAARLQNAPQLQLQCNELLPALSTLCINAPTLIRLRNEHACLDALCHQLEANQRNSTFIEQIVWHLERVYDCVRDVRQQFAHHAYPFDHAKGDISIAYFLAPEMPLENDLGAIHHAGDEILEKFSGLYYRIGGRLAEIAEQVEAVIGLPRLDPPPEDD